MKNYLDPVECIILTVNNDFMDNSAHIDGSIRIR